MICHRGVTNYLAFLGRQCSLGADCVALQVSGISFDPSVRDIFGPLLHGGRVVLMPTAHARDPEAVRDIIQRESVSTILSIIPRVLAAVLPVPAERGALQSLREILTCGEPLYAQQCEAVRAIIPRALLVNQYGPTECTMACASYAVPEDREGAATIPIGRPIGNVRFYVLDSWLQPVPAGSVGELHIESPGLGRGYASRPGHTAARFIASPFSRGTRMYKTGDLVRYRADGNVEFVGRNDGQVKIRGHRIEPAEVEAVLLHCPTVREAAVIAPRDALGEPRLVAYVTQAAGDSLNAIELRKRLRALLPEYMLPSAIVLLEAMPVTPNGKIDRARLPVIEGKRTEIAEFIAPRTATEEALAEIWCEMLELDRVGVDDDFFVLGGHSLMAIRVVARVRTALSVELALKELFECRTLGQLAERIDSLRWAQEAGREKADPSGSQRWEEGEI
jgi:pristinamycin I synthase-3/4